MIEYYYVITPETRKGYIKIMPTYDIFLSYRRDGGETMAILLRDRLTAKGFKVFLDIESLNSGTFNKQLFSVINDCVDFVVVCSKGSLDRCVNDGDWVRMEIAHALEKEKNVVPVILRDFQFPGVLPGDIEALRLHNGVNASSHEYFDAAIDRLAAKFLKSKPRLQQLAPQPQYVQPPQQQPQYAQPPQQQQQFIPAPQTQQPQFALLLAPKEKGRIKPLKAILISLGALVVVAGIVTTVILATRDVPAVILDPNTTPRSRDVTTSPPDFTAPSITTPRATATEPPAPTSQSIIGTWTTAFGENTFYETSYFADGTTYEVEYKNNGDFVYTSGTYTVVDNRFYGIYQNRISYTDGLFEIIDNYNDESTPTFSVSGDRLTFTWDGGNSATVSKGSPNPRWSADYTAPDIVGVWREEWDDGSFFEYNFFADGRYYLGFHIENDTSYYRRGTYKILHKPADYTDSEMFDFYSGEVDHSIIETVFNAGDYLIVLIPEMSFASWGNDEPFETITYTTEEDIYSATSWLSFTIKSNMITLVVIDVLLSDNGYFVDNYIKQSSADPTFSITSSAPS